MCIILLLRLIPQGLRLLLLTTRRLNLRVDLGRDCAVMVQQGWNKEGYSDDSVMMPCP